MGAAQFDQYNKMRQLCSRECERAHGLIKYVSGCESKIPLKHSSTYASTNHRTWGSENLASLGVQLKDYEPQFCFSGPRWRRIRGAVEKGAGQPWYTAELINRRTSINNRPPSSGWKLLSLANSCSVTAPLSTGDLLHEVSCLPRRRKNEMEMEYTNRSPIKAYGFMVCFCILF